MLPVPKRVVKLPAPATWGLGIAFLGSCRLVHSRYMTLQRSEASALRLPDLRYAKFRPLPDNHPLRH